MKSSLLVTSVFFVTVLVSASTVLNKTWLGEIARINETPDRTKAELPDSISGTPLVFIA